MTGSHSQSHFFRLDLIRLDNFLVPMQCTGNLGCFPRGKQAEIVQRYPVFCVCFFPVCSFLCLRNPPNSDMDYMIFKVRTRSFLCACIHIGVGHTDKSTHFDSEKLTIFFIVLRTGFQT